MLSFDHMAIACGDKFPDALVSVGVLGPNRSAILLVASDDTDEATHERIDRIIGGNKDSISMGYILGGTGAVNSTVEQWAYEACK